MTTGELSQLMMREAAAQESLLKSWEAAAISENTKGRAVLRKESEESRVTSEHPPNGGVNAA
jgi:hypothetical protein